MDTINNNIDANLLSKEIESIAQKESILKWDISAFFSNDTSVQVDKGEAKQLKSSQRSSITIRVWNNEGLVGITSSSDLSHTGLIKAIRGAHKASKYGNRKEIPDFSSRAKENLSNISRPIQKPKGIKYLFKKLVKAESILLKKHKSINSIPYNGLSESKYGRIYINSDGAIRNMERTQASIYLYARAEERNKKPRSSGALRVSLGINELEINDCIEEAAKKTIDHLCYQPINTGKYLVCFSPDSFIDLIGSFSNMFNARAILDGISLSDKDSLGKTISVPYLNLYDNALHPENITANTFDGEGTPTGELCLIKKGKLSNFMHSESTARVFGVSPTGHAGIGAKASVGCDWLEIRRSDSNLSLMKQYNHNNLSDTFVLVDSLSALHSGVKSSQGSFSLPFDGWLVNNKKRVSIEAATIAGDILQVLKNIVCIEEKQEITQNGLSPYIWVENLSITGEG